MTAYGYHTTGGVDVLESRPSVRREPDPHEVEVRIVASGINPTDVKSRVGALHMPIPKDEIQVPHHDGAGIITKVGREVASLDIGHRVWTHLAAYRRLDGTAQDYVTLPADLVSPLPDHASFDLGASLGTPFLTAHRVLTLAPGAPGQLAAGSLEGATVLVAGGAGAVGNATIQLAHWAGAAVVTTVSSSLKAALAEVAGAHHTINYRTDDVALGVRRLHPAGVDLIAEVSPASNGPIDLDVLTTNGTIAVYANDGGDALTIPVRQLMGLNASLEFVILYTLTDTVRRAAVAGVQQALLDGALGVGAAHGLPIHHFSFDRIADAHSAVEGGTIGKVLLSREA
jgi:NADPH2:quinone reductase